MKINFTQAIPPFEYAGPLLVRNRYGPVPLTFGQKRPIPTDWLKYSLAEGDQQRYAGAGTGLICGQLIAADIDVYDPDIAQELAALARQRFGEAPTRVGLAPKSAMIYRVEGEPFKKLTTHAYRLPGEDPQSKPHRIEILANGQQLVAFNIHPETGKAYRWIGGRSPLTVPFSRLRAVSLAQVQEFLRQADAILAVHGTRVGSFEHAEIAQLAPNAELRAANPEELREALTFIPNDDEEYDDWIRIVYAVKGALGEAGRADLMRWSAKSSKDDPETTAKAWEAARPTRIGAGTVFFHARRNGWQPKPGSPRTRPWPVPTPLMREPAPGLKYPVAALGPTLRDAAEAVIEIAQVPAALAANSLLAVSALAAQPFANVETLAAPRPLSLNLITVAHSGDRKTTADAIALAPVRLRIVALQKNYAEEMREYKAYVEAHKLSLQKAHDSSGDDPDKLAAALLKLREPVPPRKPLLLCSEPTPEGLFLSLRDGQYSQGLFSDEGGTFVGSYAMSEESELRTISMLSRLWDGGWLDRVRAKDTEQTVLAGRRLTFHLMMQPVVAARLLGRAYFRQQGFLARCLVTAPASLAGTRLHDPDRPRSDDLRIRAYEAAVTRLLWESPVLDAETGDGIRPRTIKLSFEAKRLLVAAYDQMERAQGPGGPLAPVREWASKAAEHACRVAAVITLVTDPHAGEVSAEAMQGAIALVEFYLNEYIRLVDGFSPSPEVDVAQKLLEWLRDKRLRTTTVRHITQYGPSSARVAETARRALRMLADHDWVRTRDGRTWDVHPEIWVSTAEGTAP